MLYKVNEIFYSIQGEGRNTGMAAVFIRLAGCNLKCSWCDTDHSVKQETNEVGIVNEIKAWPCSEVILTGGEPTCQDLFPLLKSLKQAGYWVGIETNGTNDLLRYKGAGLLDWITVSPKTQEIAVDAAIDELKVIWPVSFDLKRMTRIRAKFRYIQPCDDANYDKNVEEAVKFIKENPEWRLSIQTQKILNIR